MWKNNTKLFFFLSNIVCAASINNRIHPKACGFPSPVSSFTLVIRSGWGDLDQVLFS